MYYRDISRLPVKINREDFVEWVFEIGLAYQHSYDSIVTSIEIGDNFVASKNNRKSSIEQIYSIELAYVVTVMVGKFNEDVGYNMTKHAKEDTQNHYVVKMEWEIFGFLNYHIKIRNIITLISNMITTKDSNESRTLSSIFWDLSKDICIDERMMKINPFTVLLACRLLYKRRKLRAIRSNKIRIALTVLLRTAKEYAIPPNTLLRTYIKYKQESIQISEDSSDEMSEPESSSTTANIACIVINDEDSSDNDIQSSPISCKIQSSPIPCKIQSLKNYELE